MDYDQKSREELLHELMQLRRWVSATQRRGQESPLFPEVAPLGIEECDIEGRITYVTPSYEAITGYSADDLIGTYVWDKMEPGPLKDTLPTYLKHLVQNQPEPTPFICRRLHKNGDLYDICIDWHYKHDAQGQMIGFISIVSDITKHKTAADFEESERKLTTLMSNLPGMAYRCRIDLDWTMEFLSQGCFALTGYLPADFTQHRTVSLGQLIHPDDRQMVWDTVLRGVAERRHFQIEYRICSASGEIKWVWEQGVGIFSDDGTPEALEGFISDITDRKKIEEALKNAHDELERGVQERTRELAASNEDLALFRKFAEASGEGFGMSDLTGRIAYINPTLCRLFGEDDPSEIVGKYVFDYYPEEYALIRKNNILPALLEDGYWLGEQVVFPRGNKPVYTSQSSFLIRDEAGNPLRIAVVISDITELKAAQDALAESAAKYRQLIETTDTGYLILDQEGRVVDFNSEYVRLTGRKSPDDVLGHTVLEWTAPYDIERNSGEVSKCLAGGCVRQLEVDYIGPNGKIIPIEVNSSSMNTKEGHFVIALCRDITERKKAQLALQREHRTLKHLLHSSDHERQLIAYEIHDGLAQYLAGAIMQFHAFDYQKVASPDSAKTYETGMEMVQKSLFEARRLIAGVRPPILDESGVVAAIGHLVNEKNQFQANTHIIYRNHVDFDRLPSPLENSIYRIAQEALTNACQYSKSQRVRIGLLQHGDRVRIDVRDWGIGFDVKQVHKGHFGIEGIRQRARLLGGTCIIRSTPGRGTRVVVEIPLVTID